MSIKRSTAVIAAIAAILALLLLTTGGAAAQNSGGFQAAGMSGTWHMVEGCTDYGMETWLLLQNPFSEDSNVEVTFITEAGAQEPPLALVVPAESRRTIDVGSYLVSGQVSANVVTTSGAPVIAERAMYGNGRTWGTATMGAPYAYESWFFAEGCTAGGMETWLLVLNPTPEEAVIDIDLMTGDGPIPGLTGQAVPAFSRRTFDLGETATTYDLAATVTTTAGYVACERTMFGASRAWATCTVGTPQQDISWNFAEGCTAGGMETWILLANPWDDAAQFSIDFYSDGAKTGGPVSVDLPAHSRRSVNAGDYVQSYEVSSIVSATGPIVCERSMYGNERTWATSSTAFGSLATWGWAFPEGCTLGGFETWLTAFNPTDEDTAISVVLLDASGVPVPGPQDVAVPSLGRVTLKLNDYLADYDASFLVGCDIEMNGRVVCERTMFGNDRAWASGSVGIPGGPI